MRHYGSLVRPLDMRDWPNATEDGYDFGDMLAAEGVTSGRDDARFWQAAVRWALLKKYGYLTQPTRIHEASSSSLEDPFVVVENNQKKVRTLQFSERDLQPIADLWNEQCALATTSKGKDDDTNDDTNDDDDLRQFLRTGGRSNDRPLQWSVLDCGPACQFQLHAHPNLEVIYCMTGALHEIRLAGAPVTKTFVAQKVQQEEEENTTGNRHDTSDKETPTSTTTILQGPDLSQLQRPWKFDTLNEGEFLVNEVGSIHKSFTATNSQGCRLLVCWGGSHADVTRDQEPTSVSVQGALETMDARLSTCDGCGGGGDSVTALSETFLPASERSDAV